MDPYADEILEALGLPTSIARFRDLNHFQVLGVDPSVDADGEIMRAASLRMRKVREFAKGGTRDYANEMERMIIQARNTLRTEGGRRMYRQQLGLTPPDILLESEPEVRGRTRPSAAARTAYDKAPPAKKRSNLLFLVILIILILIAVIAVVVLGPQRVRQGARETIEGGRRAVEDVSE